MDEVKRHKFFKNLDWNELLAKEIEPPYKPSMHEVNIANEFTSIPVMFNFEEEITRDERKLRSHFDLSINDEKMSGLKQHKYNLGEILSNVNKISAHGNHDTQKVILNQLTNQPLSKLSKDKIQKILIHLLKL